MPSNQHWLDKAFGTGPTFAQGRGEGESDINDLIKMPEKKITLFRSSLDADRDYYGRHLAERSRKLLDAGDWAELMESLGPAPKKTK